MAQAPIMFDHMEYPATGFGLGPLTIGRALDYASMGYATAISGDSTTIEIHRQTTDRTRTTDR